MEMVKIPHTDLAVSRLVRLHGPWWGLGSRESTDGRSRTTGSGALDAAMRSAEISSTTPISTAREGRRGFRPGVEGETVCQGQICAPVEMGIRWADDHPPHPNALISSRDLSLKSVDATLARPRTDRFGILLLHVPILSGKGRKSPRLLDNSTVQAKCVYFGVSNQNRSK